MFYLDGLLRSLKGASSRQPLVDHDSERVLITCWFRHSLPLFWRHIGCAPSCYIFWLSQYQLLMDCDAKITDESLPFVIQQDILWLDIAMNKSLIVDILQS